MLLFEEIRTALLALRDDIQDLAEAIGYARLKERTLELEALTSRDGFWEDLENSRDVLQELKRNQSKTAEFDSLKRRFDDCLTLVEMAMEEKDESVLADVKAEREHLAAQLETMKLATVLIGEYDANNAILTFHAGAGGTEAQDWVQMLYRMYTRWAERHDCRFKILDYFGGDEAGIKSASILIEGQNAYGFLKSESGVHRLVRVSPFDTSGRRHTSFASIEVMPEIIDDTEVKIDENDLRVDTYRSGGAGGQHVNKTESAIRLTHLPTGLVVACQNERSQHQNREVAMKMLRSKLAEIKERQHLERIEDIKGVQKEIAWGSQIRSYVFMPYTLVKDHRTGFESGNIGAVMDGDIDGFMNAYLKASGLGEL